MQDCLFFGAVGPIGTVAERDDTAAIRFDQGRIDPIHRGARHGPEARLTPDVLIAFLFPSARL